MADLFSGSLAASALVVHNLQTLRTLSAGDVWCCMCWGLHPAAHPLLIVPKMDSSANRPYSVSLMWRQRSAYASQASYRGPDVSHRDWAYLGSPQTLLVRVALQWRSHTQQSVVLSSPLKSAHEALYLTLCIHDALCKLSQDSRSQEYSMPGLNMQRLTSTAGSCEGSRVGVLGGCAWSEPSSRPCCKNEGSLALKVSPALAMSNTR